MNQENLTLKRNLTEKTVNYNQNNTFNYLVLKTLRKITDNNIFVMIYSL